MNVLERGPEGLDLSQWVFFVLSLYNFIIYIHNIAFMTVQLLQRRWLDLISKKVP